MTRRRYIFHNKEDGRLYISPEFNGDAEEFVMFKARMDTCDITWTEIEELLKKVSNLEEFKKANEEIQTKYHSFLEAKIPKQIEKVKIIGNFEEYKDYYKQLDQLLFIGNNHLYAVDADGTYEEDVTKSIHKDNQIDLLELVMNLDNVGIKVDKVKRNILMNPESVYIEIIFSNIKLLRIHEKIEEKYNCINIYSGTDGGRKNGYWYDSNIDYKDFAKELLQYHSLKEEEEIL